MKLSVCIPVYNFDVRALVYELKNQIEDNHLDAEIILIDDASNSEFKEINKEVEKLVESFIFLENNIGRAAIRNQFLKYSSGDFLLFLDCDVTIKNHDFLKKYMNVIEDNPSTNVFYGGFVPDSRKNLRNLYTLKRESSVNYNPDDIKQLKTVNFVVDKEILIKFPFDELLVDYGYEDFIFAKQLENNNIVFQAIDNPVIHSDNDTNEDFLKKTDTAIDTLVKFSKLQDKHALIKDIKLFQTANKIKTLKLEGIFLILFSFLKNIISSNLKSRWPSLFLFDIYRLGILVGKMK